MYPERKLNSKAVRNETLFWMIVGPALIVLVFMLGLGVIFLAPVYLVYCLFSSLFTDLQPIVPFVGRVVPGVLFVVSAWRWYSNYSTIQRFTPEPVD